MLPLCTVVRDGGSRPHPPGMPWCDRARDPAPCVACGHGDNSSQHWARFCIVPVLVANILSPSPNPVKSLDQLARVNTAGCVIASHILHQFRRLLLEHGGMQHAPSSVPLSVPEWLTRLHDNALQAIPTRFLPEPASPIRPQHAGANNQTHPCPATYKLLPMKQLHFTQQHFLIWFAQR